MHFRTEELLKPDIPSAAIPIAELPQCNLCHSLLRPHVVWFGESLDETVLQRVHEALDSVDLFIVVGTSAVVYPAAMWAPMLLKKGKRMHCLAGQ